MKYSIMFLLLNLSLYQNVIAKSLTYNNLYLSYVSAIAAESIALYVQQEHLGGIVLRDFRGDTEFKDNQSLLKAIISPFKTETNYQNKPLIFGVWSNEGVYANDPQTRAILEPAYGVPGSKDNNGYPVQNKDFINKLRHMNGIIYNTLQAQTETHTYFDYKTNQIVTIYNKTPEAIGTLYFTDPHADLATSGTSFIQDSFCRKNNTICDFTLSNQNQPIELKDRAKMGNFTSFSLLEHTDLDQPFNPLYKLISVGGENHESTFEDTFKNPNGIANFVNSASTLINAFQIDGINLDYENPQMTVKNAEQFSLLVKQLKEAMPDKIISVTILSEETYLNGSQEGIHGFPIDTLSNIATYASLINLITYHVDGAFIKTLDGSITSSFLSNLTIPSNAPDIYQFSIENSVNAALKAGISPKQLLVSIPTYGSALAGVSNENNGLFNILPETVTIPQGDLDNSNCSVAITSLRPKRCRGAFQYRYILNQMLNNGLTETNHTQNNQVIGTTAYGKAWSVPTKTHYLLKITNLGKLSDLAFNVTIGDFLAPNFFNINTDKTYDAETTTSINGQENLSVKWTTSWGPNGQCPTKLNFTRNTHIIMKITPDNTTGKYITYCTFAGLGDLSMPFEAHIVR